MKIKKIIKLVISKTIQVMYSLAYKFIPVDDKLVIFISFHGRGYSDNPRAIYEAMKKDSKFDDYRFIWFIKNHKKKNIFI